MAKREESVKSWLKWQETEDVPLPRKKWVPLENNPDIFNRLLHNWGVSDDIAFHDIYSLDDPELISIIPRPCYALLATIPRSIYEIARRASHDLELPIYKGNGETEPVLWFRQTIGNACGSIGALHAVANGGAKAYITPGSRIANLIKDALPLAPRERAQLLYDSEEFEAAHQSVMMTGQSAAPLAEEENTNHFIAFVCGDDSNLWELEGGVNGPLNRGKLAIGEDALSRTALDLGVCRILQMAKDGGCEDINLSCVALAPRSD